MAQKRIETALFNYCLWLGDTNLISGHRLSEWCGHGPILEEDIAMTNIALDLIGQSRALLTYACELEGKGKTEDDLAYHRDAADFKNAMLAEQPNVEFGNTMVRQFLLDTFNYHLYSRLATSADEKINALAAKSLKEITYHHRHSAEWIKRLGDGTAKSHERAQAAIYNLWKFTDDLFDNTEEDDLLIKEKIVPDLKEIKEKWIKSVKEAVISATLKLPDNEVFMVKGSRRGNHTEHLGYILAEMQFLPRAYPDAKW